MRIGQQHAATIERPVAPHRHSVTAAVEAEALLMRVSECKGLRARYHRRGSLGWRGADQGFGELADTAFHQQPTGQFHQIFRHQRPYPRALALCRSALFLQVAVIAGHIAFDTLLDLRTLGLPEGCNGLGGIQPGEEHVAGQVVALLQGRLLGAEKPRALAIHRDHFVGQQAEVVLGIGVTDAQAQAAFIAGTNMWNAEAGAPDIR